MGLQHLRPERDAAKQVLEHLWESPLQIVANISEPEAVEEAFREPAAVRVGIGDHRDAVLAITAPFDILLTTREGAAAPWIGPEALALSDALSALNSGVNASPAAAAILAQVLRVGERLAFNDALVVESLAYSTLLKGAEFRTWREVHTPRACKEAVEPVRLERRNDRLLITLSVPVRRNALSSALRNALVEALTLPTLDPSISEVVLEGEGPAFCSGGDLDEFGQASDVALAHHLRLAQSPARMLHALGPRAIARVHGACVGGGMEIAAAASTVIASADATFRLPEVGMGLIPGAGGTVTLPRRVGRSRTLFLALSGVEIDARTALGWGLVDQVA